MTSTTASPGLRAQLRAVEAAHPLHHWHLYLSSEGRIWAACPHNTCGGSGTTVDAGTTEGIDRAIAVVENEWTRAAA